jgi:hypothetical protein
MTNYTQKKQYTQNTTTKMLGLNAHTGLRAGLSNEEWKQVFTCLRGDDDKTPRQCIQHVVSNRASDQP